MTFEEPNVEQLLAAHGMLRTDPQRAIKELLYLTDMGSALAPLYLGWAYESGDGVSRDDSQAEHWYKISASKGSAHASFYLGNFYSGLGRYDEANTALEQGLQLGFSPSMYRLAKNLLEGKPKKNVDRAKQLLEIATNQGHVFAMRDLGYLYSSGHFGFLKRGYGSWLLVKSLMLALRMTYKNVDDDRLRT